ncbi:RNA-binding protein S4 [Clostridiales bacterium PH28_bin88]|nr:RNA-binding protein S4 [Clostridiales bacterium PH28_bin88]
MRLDKWLKVSRIIKRRTLAKEVCDGGRVAVNGRPAKASTELKVGDVVAVNFGSRILRVEVLATPDSVRADAAKDIYRVISD